MMQNQCHVPCYSAGPHSVDGILSAMSSHNRYEGIQSCVPHPGAYWYPGSNNHYGKSILFYVDIHCFHYFFFLFIFSSLNFFSGLSLFSTLRCLMFDDHITYPYSITRLGSAQGFKTRSQMCRAEGLFSFHSKAACVKVIKTLAFYQIAQRI